MALVQENFKIYLNGHTHTRKNEVIDGIHVINPGSIRYPRGSKCGYAIVHIDEKSVKCNFYDLDNI